MTHAGEAHVARLLETMDAAFRRYELGELDLPGLQHTVEPIISALDGDVDSALMKAMHELVARLEHIRFMHEPSAHRVEVTREIARLRTMTTQGPQFPFNVWGKVRAAAAIEKVKVVEAPSSGFVLITIERGAEYDVWIETLAEVESELAQLGVEWPSLSSERIGNIVRACLKAVAESDALVPDWEFSTLIGFERAEMEPICEAWSIDDAESVRAGLSVLSCLIGYPGISDAALVKACGFSSDELAACLEALHENR